MYIADGDYIKDIEVNDLRNRYTLTKGSTQKMVIIPAIPTDTPRPILVDCASHKTRVYISFFLSPFVGECLKLTLSFI